MVAAQGQEPVRPRPHRHQPHPASLRTLPAHPHRPGPDHQLIQFDGHARITDARLLAQSICRGIGRAQSYGAGLLSLAPV
ncbi:type I-E CRISPR-associated protein Cas6/Cse3/CasE [Streptomyces chartreusis]